MNFAFFHHYPIAILAGAVAVLLIILLFSLRKRAPKAPEQNDDLQEKLSERLASGRFSRAPSNWRRKVVVDPTESEPTDKPRSDQ